MRSNTTCWHGFPLVEVPHPEWSGWVVERAPSCALCEAEGWTGVPFLKDPPQASLEAPA